MSRIVTFEQFNSLVRWLAAIGLQNGDVGELTLRHVGIRPSLYDQPCLAFCPSVPYDLRLLKRGHKDERRLPFVPELRLGLTLQQSVLRDAPRRGFLDIALLVDTRGVVELNGSIERVEVASRGFAVHSPLGYKNWLDMISPKQCVS